MYKMIVCDLDETLLNDAGKLTDENIAAIKAATAKGVKFVANSGRGYTSFQDTLSAVDLKGKSEQYAISFNGGLILENKDNRAIAINEMPFDIAKKIFAVASADPIASTHVYTKESCYIYHLSDEDAKYLESRGVKYEIMEDGNFDRFKDDNVMKIIMQLPTMDQRKQMQKDVEKVVPADKLAVTYSSGMYVEINPGGVDKGTATVQLGEILGIKPDEIIAIGDNGNDLAMLNAVGMPVGVANSIDEVKKAVKYITKADNNNSAVAETIKKFILEA